ncbi:hypothetical protein FRC03_008743 [Tulasnella sp. 419]|nr:hypothetical protein FRC03_008743 [Tulasnella sp. 419]
MECYRKKESTDSTANKKSNLFAFLLHSNLDHSRMASQAKLTLRPPPNVEFVQGFPGIPPQLPDRPPASVKGTVELRLGGGVIKAKWVKVELRKVETLPGGGQANTYIDFIGESPLTVWHAKNEWDELSTHDFPFQIRIPESIPPSIALERGAGIKYELVASVLVKGKKGLLRREATQPLTSSCPVIIDKHELHSTWPIYAQPESRTRSSEGFTLIVNRSHTCYAPGDRIAVFTIVKNDTPNTTPIRHYEFSLLELVVYRPGPHGGAKKNNAQIRKMAIQEAKIPITYHQPLGPGMQAKAELSLLVPPNHTTTTVSWAQRIEVTYVLHVKVVLNGGQNLALDLPVTITNWTREQSMNAVRRIGTAPNLSGPPALRNSVVGFNPGGPMQPPPANGMVNGAPPGWNQPPRPNPPMGPNGFVDPNVTPAMPNTIGYAPGGPVNGNRPPDFSGGWNPAQQPATYAGPGSQPIQPGMVDEFGINSGAPRPTTMYGVNGTPNHPPSAMPAGAAPAVPPAGGGGRSVAGSEEGGRPPTGRNRPSSANTATAGNARFTIVNADPDESLPKFGTTYMSAEDEKRKIRQAMEEADKRGMQSQGSSALPSYLGATSEVPSTSASSSSSTGPSQTTAPSTQSPDAPSSSMSTPRSNNAWPSAEDEKRRFAQQSELYESAMSKAAKAREQAFEAQFSPSSSSTSPPTNTSSPPATSTPQWPSAEQEKFNLARQAVERSQGSAYVSPPGSSYGAGSSFSPANTSYGSSGGMSAGRALYQSAVSNMKTGPAPNYFNEGSPSMAPTQSYPTAIEEKEQLRYKHAMQAVEGFKTTMNAPVSPQDEGPIPYDALYSNPPSNPAPASIPVVPKEILPLKITRSRSPPSSPPLLATSDSTSFQRSQPPLPANAPFQPLDARTEKERMRLMYEQQDEVARQPNVNVAGTTIVPPLPVPQPLPADGSSSPPGYISDGGFASRPPPQLPSAAPLSQPLTAAQEKAMLKAAYERENQQASGQETSSGPIPPPMQAGLPLPPLPNTGYTTNGFSNGWNDSHPADYAHTYESGPQIPVRDPSISAGKQKDTSVPPPLAPKPPAEYYMYNEHDGTRWEEPSTYPQQDPSFGPIEVRPFSPFDMDFTDNFSSSFVPPPPPPPLPPKPQGTV